MAQTVDRALVILASLAEGPASLEQAAKAKPAPSAKATPSTSSTR